MRTHGSPANHSIRDAGIVSGEFSLLSTTVVKQRNGSDRERLITAAAQLFSRLGFKATTLRKIAAAAGRSRSAIRREFGGKAGLFESVVRAQGTDRLPQLSNGSHPNTLRQDIYQLVEWETARMRKHRNFLDHTLPQEKAGDPAFTRIAGSLSLSSTETIAERLGHHHNMRDEERKFLLYAIQSVGYALGFVQSDLVVARTKSRVQQLAGVLADSIERRNPPPGGSEVFVPSGLPI